VGFYIRKGFNFGPLRLNLSRSGLGASFGVKGARIGIGPRGSYVHVGRGGLYYRQSLGGSASSGRAPRPPMTEATVLAEIESGDIGQMTDASSAALLAELNRVQQRWDLFPTLLLAIIALVGFLSFMALNEPTSAPIPVSPADFLSSAEVLRDRATNPDQPPWGLSWWWAGGAALTLLLGVPALLWVRNLDVTRGTAVLMYDLEPNANETFTRLTSAFNQLADASAVWHVKAQGATDDWKRQAGANTLIRRDTIRPVLSKPSRVECNLTVPTLPAGRQSLYFFPDRVLVYDRNGVGAVTYGDLEARASTVSFREEDAVPTDAQVIGSTWRYVNRNGGPDRRFRNNEEIPIVAYGALRLSSPSGLDELFQCSKSAATAQFADVLESIERVDKPLP